MRTRIEIERDLIKALRNKWQSNIVTLEIYRPRGWSREPNHDEALQFAGRFTGPNRWEQILCCLTDSAFEEMGVTGAANYLGIPRRTLAERGYKDHGDIQPKSENFQARQLPRKNKA